MKLKWTYDVIREETLKYETRGEFRKGSGGAYSRALKLEILDDVCSNMKNVSYKVWTEDDLYKEALLYKTRTEFRDNSPTAYREVLKRGIMNDVSKHMGKPPKVWPEVWTEDDLYKEALLYESKTVFKQKSFPAYRLASMMNILDDVCSHMKIRYKVWTFEEIHQEALKYETRGEFRAKSNDNYQKAFKLKIMNDVCSHMKDKPRIKWTLKKAHVEALKYKTRIDFKNKSYNAYDYSIKNKHIDVVCSHMIALVKPNNYWTKKRVHQEALKYETRMEFKTMCGIAYSKALRVGWSDEVFSHLIPQHKPRGYWTKKRIHKEALKYQTRSEFNSNSSFSYKKSKQLGIDDEVCSHMPEPLWGDADVVYIWKAVGEFWNDKPIYKIGVTSQRLGNIRIEQVANNCNFDFEIISVFETSAMQAFKLETELLNYCTDIPNMGNVDGKTEFRAINNEDLDYIINRAKEFTNV